MSKIENITEKISIDAKEESERIIAEAKEKAEKIIREKEEKSNKESKIIIDKASVEANIIVEKALSSAELKARDNVLKAKEEVVERVFSIVNTKLEELSSQDFVNYLKAEISKLNLNSNATLYVPEKYYKDVVAEKLDIKISDSKKINSGFSVLNGNIMYNNEFSSIIDSKKDDLEYIVVEKLFS